MASHSVEPGLRHQNSYETGRPSSLPPTSALDRGLSLPALSQPIDSYLEIHSVVTLIHAHAHKIYMSGPLIRRVERLPDGHHPVKEEWTEVLAQLGGTTLSIWDMKEREEARKQGKEVPPTYINVTHAVGLYFYHNFCCHLTVGLVCPCAWLCHDTRVRDGPRSEIQQCCHRQHGGIQPHSLLLPEFLPEFSLSYILGCGLTTRRLGEITS